MLRIFKIFKRKPKWYEDQRIDLIVRLEMTPPSLFSSSYTRLILEAVTELQRLRMELDKLKRNGQ